MHEIRDPENARSFLLQSLWLARGLPVGEKMVAPVLGWAQEIAGSGEPLPPLGLVADIGFLSTGYRREGEQHPPPPPGFDPALARKYEDSVLGKLYADLSFERAADAVLRYQGRDRSRAVAFLIGQFRARAEFDGVILSPGVIKSLAGEKPQELLAEGWERIETEGLHALLPSLLEQIVGGVRNMSQALGPEDIFELEHGTALAGFGQRLALRQILHEAEIMENSLPHQKIKPSVRRQQAATHILDEDTYPIGGFTSISTKGTMESLLHSQLAYMETDERPDLFDIKFLRDELYYYSRDDNQFFRRRQTFVFVLDADLAAARFKDAELPCQRIVLLLALLVVAVRKLSEWLSTDALQFDLFLIVDPAGKSLTEEEELLQTLFRESVAGGILNVRRCTRAEVIPHCVEKARRSQCHLFWAASRPQAAPEEKSVSFSQLVVDGAAPKPAISHQTVVSLPADSPYEAWPAALLQLLESWI